MLYDLKDDYRIILVATTDTIFTKNYDVHTNAILKNKSALQEKTLLVYFYC